MIIMAASSDPPLLRLRLAGPEAPAALMACRRYALDNADAGVPKDALEEVRNRGLGLRREDDDDGIWTHPPIRPIILLYYS